MERKEHKSFSDVFPYLTIQDGLIICDNPMRVTSVMEVYISWSDSFDIMQYCHDKLMKIFTDTFPSDVTISIYFCKSFINPNPALYQESRYDIVNYMEKNKYDMVLGRKNPEYTVYLTITLPFIPESTDAITKIREKQAKKGKAAPKITGFTDAEIIGCKTVQEKMFFLIKTLRSSLDGRPVLSLNDGQILMFISKLINHDYVSSARSFSDIILSDWNCCIPGVFDKHDGYVFYNDNYHSVLSLRANMKDSKMPTTTFAGMNSIFMHPDIWDIPFVIQHSLYIPDRHVGLSIAQRRLSMITTREGFAEKLKFLEKTPEGMPPEKMRGIVESAIADVEAGHGRFVKQFFHVHLWAPSLGALNKVYKTFEATIKGRYQLKREKFNLKGAYFSILPGNESVEEITVTLPSYNVADFMPIDLPRWPYFDPGNKWELYYYNEMDSFCKIDMFSKGCDAWNAIVAGGTGSGKSFTEQDKLWQIMKYDPCVAIIDFGGEGMGSYLSFVKNLHGTYLEINLNSVFSLNPFEGAYYTFLKKNEEGRDMEVPAAVDEAGNVLDGGTPSGLMHTSLMATLQKMIIGNEDKKMPPTVYADLADCLRQYYIDEKNNVNNTCNLSDFANRYLKGNEVFTREPEWDLYKCLYEFVGEGKEQGAYAMFFKGAQDIVNKDIICFDMAGLSSQAKLKAVLVPALVTYIMANILGDPTKRHRKKVIIMDEAWRELQGGDMAQFMEEMFRTVRKLNGQITIITQSVDDLLRSTTANALMSNTSFYWLIGNKHNPDSLRQLKAGLSQLSDYDINVICNQKSKRDFYLLTPFYVGQLRLYPTKEFTMLATTDPNHRAIIDGYRRQFGVDYTSPEVLEALKKDARFAI